MKISTHTFTVFTVIDHHQDHRFRKPTREEVLAVVAALLSRIETTTASPTGTSNQQFCI